MWKIPMVETNWQAPQNWSIFIFFLGSYGSQEWHVIRCIKDRKFSKHTADGTGPKSTWLADLCGWPGDLQVRASLLAKVLVSDSKCEFD